MTIQGVTGYSASYPTQSTGVAPTPATPPSDDDDRRVEHHHAQHVHDGSERGGMMGFMDSIFKALGQLGLVSGTGTPSSTTGTGATGSSSSAGATTSTVGSTPPAATTTTST